MCPFVLPGSSLFDQGNYHLCGLFVRDQAIYDCFVGSDLPG